MARAVASSGDMAPAAPSLQITPATKPLVPGLHILAPEGTVVHVIRFRVDKLGQQEAYIAIPGQDKRLDKWLPATLLTPAPTASAGVEDLELAPAAEALATGSKKRRLNAPSKGPARDLLHQGDRANGRGSQRSSPDREHAAKTAVRNVENIRWSTFLLTTWYYSPYPHRQKDTESAPAPASSGTPQAATTATVDPKSSRNHAKKPALSTAVAVGPAAPPALASTQDRAKLLAEYGYNGRLWVCELCFKYMYTRRTWEHHCPSGGSMGNCDVLTPPGRCVYQRDNYRIWEVDGAREPLYCQNISLFGKLFIDHKAIHYDMDNFLFYVLCDSSTSRHDAPMAFFSKDKFSPDRYNLACIVVFPPFQGKLYGRMLIEFSYRLTRSIDCFNPGTPERPISDIGMLSYKAYWSTTILRYLAAELRKVKNETAAGGKRRTISVTPAELARAVHLRKEDMELTMRELGLVREVKRERAGEAGVAGGAVSGEGGCDGQAPSSATGPGESTGGKAATAVVTDTVDGDSQADAPRRVFAIHLERVEALCKRHKVLDVGLLKEECVRL